MNAVTTKISRATGRISGKTKEWFVATGNNLGRMYGTTPVGHSFIKIGYTSATTVRNSGMIGETYKSTVERIGIGLLTQRDRIGNSHVYRCSPKL